VILLELANAHDAGDCVVGCAHPSHDNEDAFVDLTVLIGPLGWDCPQQVDCVMWQGEPVFL